MLTTRILGFCYASLFLVQITQAFSVVQTNTIDGPVRCEFIDPISGNQYALAPESTFVHTLITDGIAQVRLEQVFTNPVNSTIQATYVFPLPHQGSIHGMTYTTEGKTFTAVIKEKAEAQTLFDSIQNSGGSAALMLQIKPNIFSQSMANIGANKSVRITVDLSMPLAYNNGVFEFAFPTMVGNRCCNSESPSITGTISGWNPPAKVGGPRIQFNTLIQTSFPIANLNSPTHPIESLSIQSTLARLNKANLLTEESQLLLPNHAAVYLQKVDTVLNSDFVLRFSRLEASQRASIATYAGSKDTTYFMMSLFPNEQESSTPRGALDVFLLVDVSGSQDGWPLEKEIEVAKLILGNLKQTDRLCLMEFDDSQYFAFPDSIRNATGTNLSFAKDFLDQSRGGGGTELYSAIQKITSIPNPDKNERIFIFLTDGFITNESQILGYLKALQPTPQIVALGAGNNLNRYFLDEVSALSGGFSYELTESESASNAVSGMFAKINAPKLTDIKVTFNAMNVFDTILPYARSVYKGSVFRLFGKTTSKGAKTATLTGMRNGVKVVLNSDINLDVVNPLSWSVPKLWARQKIASLESQEDLGLNRKDSIINISLQHQVLSKYTAFIAYQPSASDQVGGALSSTLKERKHSTALVWNQMKVLRGPKGVYFRWENHLGIQDFTVLDMFGRILFRWNAQSEHTNEAIWNTASAPNKLIVRVRTSQGVYKQVFLIP